MKFDFWCSRPPYIDHAAPVWLALPEANRGKFMVPDDLMGRVESFGITPSTQNRRGAGSHPLVILSRSELRLIPQNRRLIFMEHGVGANYESTSHLPKRHDIELILTTPANAPAHLPLYGERVRIVGCPKMDRIPRRRRKAKGERPTIVVSHHWNQTQYPETRSGFPWDKEAWARIVKSGRYRVVGHKHPGDARDIEGWWESLGCGFLERFEDVLSQADLYACDNSSTLYEFAATDRPVLVLSPPYYRRDVDFGLRFWSHLPGIECSVLDHLEACIEDALRDPIAWRRIRHAAVEYAYGVQDGRASERAVEALLSLPDRPPNLPTLHREIPARKISQRWVSLGRHVVHEGVEYAAGQRISLATAKAMKAAGLLNDPRL